MEKTLEAERDELRMRKLAIENAIRKLKVMKRNKQVMSRDDLQGKLCEILNTTRMLLEDLPETLGTGQHPEERNDVVALYRKAIFDLLTRMASRANESEESETQ